jgi:nucleotide-binding universal stress UspA family protein
VILDEAAREHADLIVMGTHGLGGFRKLLLGSTTERVLRRANTTLLVVPHQDRQAVTLESDGPRFNLTLILAATDFSDASTEACHWAATLAQRLATPLLLTHVVVPVSVPAQWQSYVAEVDEERARTARARLDTLSKELDTGVHHEAVVSVGRPAEAIASLARERDAGLIAVGLMDPHAENAPRPGSVAYRVVCLAHVPVLVVPAHS